MMPSAIARRDFARDHLLRPSASSDAARDTTENRKHWLRADSLGPVSETSPTDRVTLRKRARYECRNNPYFKGAVRSIVSDTIGTGPQLLMQTPDARLNAEVESLWRVYAAASDWALSCRVMVGVAEVVGECFSVFYDSKKLNRLGLPITLAWKLIEPDQVASPFGVEYKHGDDGIETDADGEPVAYSILKEHPGETTFAFGNEATRVDAANVLHWFEPERPGQLRGNTPWESALPIFNQLRRFSNATLTAAEVASLLAGVMTNKNLPVDSETYLGELADQEMWYDTVELVRGMLLTLPPGAEVTQFKPEQPTTNYAMFVEAKLREIGRCRNMPFGKMAGDHSRYNFSSGKMDDGLYWSDREIQRQGLEAKAFDPFLYKWLSFAQVYAIPALRKYDGAFWSLAHTWQYPARPSFDPIKDARADELNLTNAADTLTAIASRDGTTLEKLLDTRERELAEFKRRGLPLPPWLIGATPPLRNEDGTPATNQPPQRDGDGETDPAEEVANAT